MSTAELDNTTAPSPRRVSALRPDRLVFGMAFLLLMAVFQRLIGLLRNVLFCRFLDDRELGMWSLGFSFLVLLSPLAVLGLPGVFGRYVETYRQRGQLRAFLRRIFVAILAPLALCVWALLARGETVSQLVFNSPQQANLVRTIAVALPVVVAFNFVVELLTALRQVRVVSWMQFANSMLFTIAGVGLVVFAPFRSEGLVLAYAIGCLAGVACGLLLCSMQHWWPDEAVPLCHGEMWSKIAPYAGWLWVNCLLVNLADSLDRYLLVHFSALDPLAAQALVGQYHSSRVVPSLLMTFGGVIASTILPYLSHDWEAGNRESVSARLLLVLKLVAIAFTAGSALVLIGSPLLFNWALGGRYNAGLAVLPWTLTYCVYFALAGIAWMYLACAERTKLVAIAVFAGIVVNSALNCTLVPRFGLHGAVVGTTVANVLTLTLVLAFGWRQGLRLDRGLWIASALPLTILLGGWAGLVATLVVSGWLLTLAEREQIGRGLRNYWNRWQKN